LEHELERVRREMEGERRAQHELLEKERESEQERLAKEVERVNKETEERRALEQEFEKERDRLKEVKEERERVKQEMEEEWASERGEWIRERHRQAERHRYYSLKNLRSIYTKRICKKKLRALRRPW
jgi:predicted S18 family serine protease